MSERLISQGISSADFARMITSRSKQDLPELLVGAMNASLNCYIIDDEAVRSAIARFTNTPVSEISGTPVGTSADLISAIQKDKTAVGFCRFSDIYKVNSNELVENIRLLPIDRNGNRRIDYFENIYISPANFLRGVWIGKYPDELSGNIYATSPDIPSDKNTVAFLAWLVTEGDRFLNLNGYAGLASTEKETALNSLLDKPAVKPDDKSSSYSWLIILSGLLIAGILAVTI
jgi:hypothetical protein